MNTSKEVFQLSTIEPHLGYFRERGYSEVCIGYSQKEPHATDLGAHLPLRTYALVFTAPNTDTIGMLYKNIPAKGQPKSTEDWVITEKTPREFVEWQQIYNASFGKKSDLFHVKANQHDVIDFMDLSYTPAPLPSAAPASPEPPRQPMPPGAIARGPSQTQGPIESRTLGNR